MHSLSVRPEATAGALGKELLSTCHGKGRSSDGTHRRQSGKVLWVCLEMEEENPSNPSKTANNHKLNVKHWRHAFIPTPEHDSHAFVIVGKVYHVHAHPSAGEMVKLPFTAFVSPTQSTSSCIPKSILVWDETLPNSQSSLHKVPKCGSRSAKGNPLTRPL